MGMFNSIMADLLCPTTGALSTNSEIQIKWQHRDARALTVYRLGDLLEELESGYDDTWIRTDYICNACSPKTTNRAGDEYIRVEDQRWHVAFVQIAQSRIARILPEREFAPLGGGEFVDDVWPGPDTPDTADPGHP